MTSLRLSTLARPLAALTLLHLALLLAWSVAVPTFRGADEHVHHDFVRRLADDWSYPEYDDLLVSQRTLVLLGDSPVYPADVPAVPADRAIPREDRSGWADLGPDLRAGTPPNQMPQHPPLYYEGAAAAVRVLDADGDLPLDRSVWQLRLLDVLLLLPLPLLAADIARRYTSSRTVVLVAAAGVLAVPQLTHVGATVSNDPLMILLGSLTLAGAARLATGDRRWTTVVLTGVAAGLALFTKGFAVPLVPAVALAVLLPVMRAVRARRRERDVNGGHAPDSPTSAAGRAAVVAGLALVFGGWWWIRNVVAYGTPQPGVRLRDRVEGVDIDVVEFGLDFGDRLIGSFWGNFGWREASLPIGLSVALAAVALAAALVACWRRWDRLVLLVPAVGGALMVLSAGWGAYKKTGVSFATQGRYLFTGVVGLAVLVALGLARLSRTPRPWAAPAAVVVALAMQALGLLVAVDRYWAGDGLDRLRALGRFSPLPGPATAGILAAVPLCGLAAVAILALEARTTRRGERATADEPPVQPTGTDRVASDLRM